MVFDTINAYQRTAALRAAIELDLFTAIGSGINSSPALAAHASASERGVRVLCDYLTVIGFLSKAQTEYCLTRDSAVFLDKRSPAYLGGAIGFLLSPSLTSPVRRPGLGRGAPRDRR